MPVDSPLRIGHGYGSKFQIYLVAVILPFEINHTCLVAIFDS